MKFYEEQSKRREGVEVASFGRVIVVGGSCRMRCHDWRTRGRVVGVSGRCVARFDASVHGERDYGYWFGQWRAHFECDCRIDEDHF